MDATKQTSLKRGSFDTMAFEDLMRTHKANYDKKKHLLPRTTTA
jgi:hypothetical protein